MSVNESEISIEIGESTFPVEGHYPQHEEEDAQTNINHVETDHENHQSKGFPAAVPAALITNSSSSCSSSSAVSTTPTKAGTMSPQSSPQFSESSPLYPPVSHHGRSSKCRNWLLCPLKWLIGLYFPSVTFAKFFIHASIPPLANNLVPLFFIGNIPNESALALAGQFTFIGIIIEVIQEGIVNSLFHYVGRNYKGNRERSLQALKICLAILLSLGCVLSVLMILLSSQFVDFIDTPVSIAEATRHFLYTSAFSYPLSLVDAALSSFLLITTSSFLITAQLSNVTISFLCNFLLFGGQSFSLHWNVEELGYYKIIQAFLSCTNNFVFCLIIERRSAWEFIFKIPLTKDLKENFKDLFQISWGNFGDSAVRNFFYFVVTLKFINNLGETEVAAWNLLNSIVWGLLLIPSFTVANYAKVKIGHRGNKTVIRSIANESFKCLTVWLLIVSILSYVLWPHLANFFGKSNEDAQVLSTKMLHEMGWIFIIFSFNNAMDSLFIGVGKTQYVFYQSLLTNLIIYFVPWLLYLFKVITPSYWLVIGLYISGMLVDFALTAFFSFRVWAIIPDC